MPESARWLHSKKKSQKAENILRRIAKMNKQDTSVISLSDKDSQVSRFKNSAQQSEPEETASESQRLIQNPDLRTSEQRTEPNLLSMFGTLHSAILTMTCGASWFCGSLIYYGITYNVQNIGGNIFVNSVLLALFEIPSLFYYIAMDIFGRKKAFVYSMLTCAVACAILPFTEPLLEGKVEIGFAVLVKLLAAGAFNMLFIYIPELCPTQLRSTGMTFCSAVARVAALASPFIIEIKLGPYNCAPFLIFALCGVVTSLAVQFVGVETKGRRFITTVEEYERMAKTKHLESLNTKNDNC